MDDHGRMHTNDTQLSQVPEAILIRGKFDTECRRLAPSGVFVL